jgi:hypothetical protein
MEMTASVAEWIGSVAIEAMKCRGGRVRGFDSDPEPGTK